MTDGSSAPTFTQILRIHTQVTMLALPTEPSLQTQVLPSECVQCGIRINIHLPFRLPWFGPCLSFHLGGPCSLTKDLTLSCAQSWGEHQDFRVWHFSLCGLLAVWLGGKLLHIPAPFPPEGG